MTLAVTLVCVYGIIGLPASKEELYANLSERIVLGLDLKGGTHLVLQVQVQVTGDYLVANHQLTRGTAVSAADFRTETGRLDTLPARALVDGTHLAEAIALRDIPPGQPVTASMLRQPWRVKTGQSVMVTASGDGFNASSEGRALSNAGVAQTVRVRMGNGQVVSGRVGEDGNILISL